MEKVGRPFVTVVMPVYNAAKTIDYSLQSLLAQTYTEWELICVDDGSKDNSLEILNKYAASDKRIKVISQENGGVAAARKTAYLAMDSEYAINLDADDAFSPDLVEECVNKAKATGADIIVPNCICEISETRSFDWNKAYGYTISTEMTGLEAFSKTFIPSTMHGYLMWKSDLLKKHACGDDPVLLRTFSEDEYYRRVLFLNSESVVFCGGYYIYKANDESITKKFSANQIGYLTTCHQMVQLKDSYDIPTPVQEIIEENYLRTVISLKIKLYAYGSQLTPENRQKVEKAIKEAYKESVKFRKHIHFADKKYPFIYKFMSLSGYPIFNLACYLMSRKKYA
ncbi:MAG: glycosyltransferase [Bacteroidales bacterium]|nr:glycosyltransferase [Bacteroidales bacterium]